MIENNACEWSILREISDTCLPCVWQKSIGSIETQTVFQYDPWILLGGITHDKPTPQNMCHTHNWPQHQFFPPILTNFTNFHQFHHCDQFHHFDKLVKVVNLVKVVKIVKVVKLAKIGEEPSSLDKAT